MGDINIVKINNVMQSVRSINGQRMVSFADVDLVHNRPQGTAKAAFARHRKNFTLGVDYYYIKKKDLEVSIEYDECRFCTFGLGDINPHGKIFLTETGYFMLIKSFYDKLAWDLQCKLTLSYFHPEKSQVVESNEDLEKSVANLLSAIDDKFAAVGESFAAIDKRLEDATDERNRLYKRMEQLHRECKKVIGTEDEHIMNLIRSVLLQFPEKRDAANPQRWSDMIASVKDDRNPVKWKKEVNELLELIARASGESRNIILRNVYRQYEGSFGVRMVDIQAKYYLSQNERADMPTVFDSLCWYETEDDYTRRNHFVSVLKDELRKYVDLT